MFKIIWVLFRLAVALAPFAFMGYGGKLSIGLFVGALLWFPFAMALLFRPSEFNYSKRVRRPRKMVDISVSDPMDVDFWINEPTQFPKQRKYRS